MSTALTIGSARSMRNISRQWRQIVSWKDASSGRTAQQLWWTEGRERNRLSMLRGDVPFHAFGSREPISGQRCLWESRWVVRLFSDFSLRSTRFCSRSCSLSSKAYGLDVFPSLSGARKFSAYVRSCSHRTRLVTHSLTLLGANVSFRPIWPTSEPMYVL